MWKMAVDKRVAVHQSCGMDAAAGAVQRRYIMDIMDWFSDDESLHYPCDNCDWECDHWDAMFCCTLCQYYGGGDCESCDPRDI